MGFAIRKSVKVGPLRFNLSKSGIGVSGGFPGFRVGTGPKGHYVQVGRGGLSYRTAHQGVRPSIQNPNVPALRSADGLTEIESADVAAMTDSSSAALLEELNAKRARSPLWPLTALLTVASIWVVGNWSGSEAITWSVVGVLAVLTVVLAQRDKFVRTTVILYDLENESVQRFQLLHDACAAIRDAGGVWHLEASGAAGDRKRHAGASTLVRRKPMRPHTTSPALIATNVEIPAIPVGRQTLHFFPDRILVVDGRWRVGAVAYDALRVDVRSARFIEEGHVPSDAKVVDHTWRYVNKNGSPDRRFKNNRRLPVTLYDEVHLSSATGLNEMIQISRPECGRYLAQTLTSFAQPAD